MSNTQIQPGGMPIPALASVATDQQTIFGSGTEFDPLTTNGGSGSSGRTFQAQLNTFGSDHVGQPVGVPSGGSQTIGITAVAKSTSTGTLANAQVIGLMTTLDGPNGVTVQTDGIVTLTTAQWDAVAGTSGGLTRGDTYYLDTSGQMTSAPNGTSGQFNVMVGTGLNATQMQLATPSLPLLNP